MAEGRNIDMKMIYIYMYVYLKFMSVVKFMIVICSYHWAQGPGPWPKRIKQYKTSMKHMTFINVINSMYCILFSCVVFILVGHDTGPEPNSVNKHLKQIRF